MSKSGVFSHFGSREELQLAVVEEYHRCFEEVVFRPSIQAPRGLPRLKAMFNHWVAEVTHEVDVGSIYISGAVEFDERESVVRDALVASITAFHQALSKAAQQAIECHHLHPKTEPDQLVFEIHALILALHHDARFLRKPTSQSRAEQGFARLLSQYQP
jgi:AcrR family transcriptional regulator